MSKKKSLGLLVGYVLVLVGSPATRCRWWTGEGESFLCVSRKTEKGAGREGMEREDAFGHSIDIQLRLWKDRPRIG